MIFPYRRLAEIGADSGRYTEERKFESFSSSGKKKKYTKNAISFPYFVDARRGGWRLRSRRASFLRAYLAYRLSSACGRVIFHRRQNRYIRICQTSVYYSKPESQEMREWREDAQTQWSRLEKKNPLCGGLMGSDKYTRTQLRMVLLTRKRFYLRVLSCDSLGCESHRITRNGIRRC